MKYDWLHKDLRARRGLTYHHGNSGIPACRIIEAHFSETPTPVGTIWYRHIRKDTIDILSCYVMDYCRRCGVMSYLMEKLLESFPKTKLVVSGSGTACGKGWMKANGFQQMKDGEWVKSIKK